MPNEKDVICGMEVDVATAEYSSVVEGESFYFCSEMCKEEFDTARSIASKQSCH